ncbi:DNA translocase FtsK 4TM domain-containing protein, partial [Klebsiella pneumoniae]
FLIILLSYNRADPGFTHASQVDEIRNLGGRVGAWLADLLLFVFGASAYWWAVLLVRKVWRGWRELMSDERLPRTSMPRVDASVTWIGFALI